MTFAEGQETMPASVCVGFTQGPVEVEASNGEFAIEFAGDSLQMLSGVFTKNNGDQVVITDSTTAGFNPNSGELQWSATGVGPSGGSESLLVTGLCE